MRNVHRENKNTVKGREGEGNGGRKEGGKVCVYVSISGAGEKSVGVYGRRESVGSGMGEDIRKYV